MRRGAATLVAIVLLAGCAGPSSTEADRRVTVLAAASLTETFTALGRAFEAAHPGTSVEFSFGASSALARQLTDGAPADVFAAANAETMRAVTGAGLTLGPPRVFARNHLTIAVPAGNPADVRGLADFARPELRIAICAPQVPCGSAAETAFAAAGVTPRPDTLEQDVKAALAKVVSGEVDAALVYRSDARVPGVDHLDFPAADRAVNDYPIAVLRDATGPDDATAFRDYVLSPAGRRVLTDAGFDAP
jgi:molybdate transport system substrate-binding protein